MEAMYVYWIILLCRSGSSNENEGLYLLYVVRKSTQSEECRARVKSFILTMWVRNHSLKYKELNIYYVERCKKTGVVVDKDWNDTYFGEVEGEKHCQTCMTANEVSTFCKIFKSIRMLFNYGWSSFDTQYTFPSFSIFFLFCCVFPFRILYINNHFLLCTLISYRYYM